MFQALALIVLVAGGKYAMGAAAFIACTIGLLIGFLGDTRRTE